MRRADLLWQGGNTTQYEQLKADAALAGLSVPDFVKVGLWKSLEK